MAKTVEFVDFETVDVDVAVAVAVAVAAVGTSAAVVAEVAN